IGSPECVHKHASAMGPPHRHQRHPPAVPSRIFLSLALLAALSPLIAAQPVADSQKPALQAILTAWGDYVPRLAQSWFVAADCADWFGLKCAFDGRVISLEIANRPLLAGQSIPPAITQLVALQKLSLDHNFLGGSIPTNIGYMTALTNLSLSGNALEGEIPSSVANLASLQTLDLSANRLSGAVPDIFWGMGSLQTLALGLNAFTGSFPNSLFSLAQLRQLLVGDNKLSGVLPSSFSSLASLVALDLNGNGFYGNLPPALGSLSNLVFLDVSKNQLSGAPLSVFSSASLGVAAQATYDLSSNYFVTYPNIFTAGASQFCPSQVGGGYAEANLEMYGVSKFSGMKDNCFLGGYWNVSQSFTDGKGKHNRDVAAKGTGFDKKFKKNGNGNGNGNGNAYGKASVSSYSASSSGSATSYYYSSAKASKGGKKNPKKGSSNGNGNGNGNGASGGGASAGTGCPVGPQRRAVECVGFCGAALPAGPCGGLGMCYLAAPSNTPTCACNPGMFNVLLSIQVGKVTISYPSCSPNQGPTTPPPPMIDPGTIKRREYKGAKDTSAIVSSSYYNKYFRYASTSFTGNYTTPLWNINPAVDWRARIPATLTGAKDQGLCSACWVFAPVAAMEALYAIVYNVAPPNISEQKAIDCQGTWDCEGGRPDDAFNYIAASGGLPTRDTYPYTGILNSGSCMVTKRSLSLRRLLSEDATISTSSLRHLSESVDSSSSSAASVSPDLANPSDIFSRAIRSLKAKRAAAPVPLPPAPYAISMFETVQIGGWIGLALTVQQQPAVAYIAASAESFIKYPGGFVYADLNCFATEVVDHLVVVVGFNLLDATPHWIIRNSWGPSWGENGYMKIAIAGGPGICGMNTLPAMYPVLQTPDPCKPNPCGGGVCTPFKGKPFKNKCTCPANFMAVTNLDKTQSCTMTRVCAFFVMNPCGFGTCVDDMAGGYTCLCSLGYQVGALTDGSTTCVPAPPSTTVVMPVAIKCAQVRSTYIMSKADFITLNPTINCVKPIPAGTTVVVRNSTGTQYGCVTPYTVGPVSRRLSSFAFPSPLPSPPHLAFSLCLAVLPTYPSPPPPLSHRPILNPALLMCTALHPIQPQGDTCDTVSTMFNLTIDGLKTINPDLDCASLMIGQLLCAQIGSPQNQSCLSYYYINPGETCNDVMINTQPPISATQLYQYNPGIICTFLPFLPSLVAPLLLAFSSSAQVCVQSLTVGATRCLYGTYTVVRGDTCSSVICKVFRCKSSLLYYYNPGFTCNRYTLYVGKVLCRPR
ncbi:unnamed protein product, partial [Closterium sp. Naga37s-1]